MAITPHTSEFGDSAENMIPIRRTLKNIRIRPNAQSRHDPFQSCQVGNAFIPRTRTNSDLLQQNDLEWMSYNYRKYRTARMSLSKRRMILLMFEEDFKYFPTLRDIRDELILAQMKVIKNKSRN